MNNITFLLGFIPPTIAVLAEIFNPVSEKAIRTQYDTTARDLVPDPGTPLEHGETPEGRYENAVDNVADAVAKTASATAEISGLIPTWISITAGGSAILIEQYGYEIASPWIILWITVCGLAGIKYFSLLNYYKLAFYRVPIFKKLPFTILHKVLIDGDKLIRVVIIAVNLAIIGVVIWAWKAGDKTDHPGKENTTNKVTMIDRPLYSRHVEFPDNPLIVKLKTLNGVLVSQLNIVIMIDRPLFPDDQLSANLKNLNSVLVLQPAVRHVIVWAKAKAHHHR